MFAVFKTGGKQYRVSQGDKLRVETLKASEGASVDLDQVMMVGEGENVTMGSPTVSGAKVTAKVLSHGREKKIEIVSKSSNSGVASITAGRWAIAKATQSWKSPASRLSSVV